MNHWTVCLLHFLDSPFPPPPLQCAAGQLEGAGHEDEFLCTTCSAVLRNTDVFGAGALEAANAHKGAAQDAASSQKRLEQAAGAQGEWVSSSKVCGGVEAGCRWAARGVVDSLG